MPTECGIYQIVNRKTKETYIGSTIIMSKKERCFLSGYAQWWGFLFNRDMEDFYFGIVEYFPNDFPVNQLRER
jgi:hypothetical protein